MTRVSTSSQTAVEQALISQAIVDNIKSLSISDGEGKSFAINEDHSPLEICGDVRCYSYDSSFLYTAIMNKLLNSNYFFKKNESDADIIVFSKISYAAIDDAESLIGMPSIPIPGAGGISTPELALFSLISQYGRADINLMGIEKDTGKSIFLTQGVPRQSYYKRWSLFFFFKWKTTNLSSPF